MNGALVAQDIVRKGLHVDSPIVRGVDGEDIARFTFNRRTAFVLKHPDYVDHVLHDGVANYHKSIEYELLRAVVGLSLFTDEDESWRRHRMLLNPVMARRHLGALFDLMLAPIETFTAGIERDIEMTEAMTALTLDVVGSALFGRGMADLARRIGPTVTLALRAAERATRILFVANPPIWMTRLSTEVVRRAPLLPPPLNLVQEAMITIDDTVWDVIHARRRTPGREDDLLGLLLSVRDEHGRALPLRRVRDEACTFMLAGHETTANALAWMWYLLALNHDARERMLAEVDEVLGDGHRPVIDDLKRLSWTAACFLEAMRVFPPAWVIPRRCVNDDVVGGHRIPRDASVIIPIHTLHHDERFWADPETFDPTRFLPENARSHHRSAYLPFGGGRRVCAGQSFAVMEGTLIAAMMSRDYTYELVPGFPVVPEATLTLRPRHGLRMVARPRTFTTREAMAA
jgi:cytochrome P450